MPRIFLTNVRYHICRTSATVNSDHRVSIFHCRCGSLCISMGSEPALHLMDREHPRHISGAVLHNLITMNALLRRIHPDVVLIAIYVLVITFAFLAWRHII